ncbi:MAG: hypothetical protein AB1414_18025 [bacterium]
MKQSIRNKRLIFTIHAKKRMRQRKVNRSQVEETIFDPDEPYQLGELEEEIAIRRFGNREIWVIFEETKR